MIIPVAPEPIRDLRVSVNSSVVCSPKKASSIHPIVVPVRKSPETLGTIIVSLCIFTSLSSSHERTVSVTVVHFGPRISSTASLDDIPIVPLVSIAVMISHI